MIITMLAAMGGFILLQKLFSSSCTCQHTEPKKWDSFSHEGNEFAEEFAAKQARWRLEEEERRKAETARSLLL